MNTEEFFIATAEASRAVRDRAVQYAQIDLPVVIVGPQGSGRRRLAELIHRESARRDGPFVVLECDMATEERWAGRLFGEVSGAFSRPGLFERAGKGTLVFGDVDVAPRGLHPALCHVLGQGRFTPVGGEENPLALSCRVLATATSMSLSRADDGPSPLVSLFPRLVEVPGLAERPEDIPALIEYFLAKWNAKHTKRLSSPGQDLMDLLCRLPWTGHVQQLDTVVRDTVIASTDEQFRVDLLPHWLLTELAHLTKIAGSPVDADRVPSGQAAGEFEEQGMALARQGLVSVVQELTLNSLKSGLPLPGAAIWCGRKDFDDPLVRDVMAGTIKGCRYYLWRYAAEQVRAGAKPILSDVVHRPHPGADDWGEYIRSCLEQLYQEIKESPDDAEAGVILASEMTVEPPRRKGASREEVVSAYRRVVAALRRRGEPIPGRDAMIPVLESQLNKNVSAGYVTEARQALGHDKKRGLRGKPTGLDIVFEEKAVAHERERMRGEDAQAALDAQIDQAATLDRYRKLDESQQQYEAGRMHISLDDCQDHESKSQRLAEAFVIWDDIKSKTEEELAEEMGVDARKHKKKTLQERRFQQLWRVHLAATR